MPIANTHGLWLWLISSQLLSTRQQSGTIAIEFDMTGIDLIAIVPHATFIIIILIYLS